MAINLSRRIKHAWSAPLAALLISAAWPVQAETLGDALISAYRSSDLLEQNRAVLRAADEDVASAVATLRPVVSWVLQSKYTHTRQINSTNSSPGLNFDWQIYDFGRSKLGIEIAKESVLATRQSLVAVEQNVLLDAVSAYMDVRRATQSVDINQTSVDLLGEQLKATQDRFEVGEITRTDVAEAEAALAAAKAGLAAAQGDLAVAKAVYKSAVGHMPDGKSKLPSSPALPNTLEEAQSIARRLHPAVLQAQHQAKVADLEVELAASQRRPVLALNMNAQLVDGGSDTDVGGGLQLSQPIYSGGKLSSLHRKAIAGRDAARSALTRTGVSVTQQVAIAWSGIEVARAQIAATDLQIVAAGSAFDGVREEANLGERTTLDVLDAEQTLLQARSSRATAEADLQVALYSLLAAMGLLTVEHLNLGIPTYDAEAYYNAVKSAPATSVQGASLDRVLKAIGKN